MSWLRRRRNIPNPTYASGVRSLTSRQIEILELIAAGYTNGEIGRFLFITEETVKTHVKRIRATLGARNRAALVTRGFELGYLTTSSRLDLRSPGRISLATSGNARSD